MKTTTFTFPSKADGLMIAATMWGEASGAKAQVLIAHGMAEHMDRYERFASALTGAGYLVYALDHRGHGKSVPAGEEPGSFGEAGWPGLVDDIITLGRIMKEDSPSLPLILFGHSMGSFAAQQVAVKASGELDALVLSGSAAQDKLIEERLSGDEDENPLEALNEGETRTPFDWLSRDDAEVDKYIADPLCGFALDDAAMGAMVVLGLEASTLEATTKIRSDLPVLLIAGTEDPVNGNMAFLKVLEERWREAGIKNIETHYYEGARHELLNETNKEEVTERVIGWMDGVV